MNDKDRELCGALVGSFKPSYGGPVSVAEQFFNYVKDHPLFKTGDGVSFQIAYYQAKGYVKYKTDGWITMIPTDGGEPVHFKA